MENGTKTHQSAKWTQVPSTNTFMLMFELYRIESKSCRKPSTQSLGNDDQCDACFSLGHSPILIFTAPCHEPAVIPDGHRTVSNLRHGSSVTYRCSQGFTLQGQAQLICQNGNWSSPPPTCTQASGNHSLAYLYKHPTPDISQSLFAVFLMEINFPIRLIQFKAPRSTATSTVPLVASTSPPMTTWIGGGIREAHLAPALGRVLVLGDQVPACPFLFSTHSAMICRTCYTCYCFQP